MTTVLGPAYHQCAPHVEALLGELQPSWKKRAGRILNPFRKPHHTMYVVCTPWHNCPVAYFSMIIGAALSRWRHVEICFLVDDIPYPSVTSVQEAELRAIVEMCKAQLGGFRLLHLRELPSSDRPRDLELVEGIAKEAVKYDVMHRLGNRIMESPPPASFVEEGTRQLADKGRRLMRFWRSEIEKRRTIGSVLVPGGLVNGSWVYTRLAGYFEMRSASFDSGEGTLYLSMNGIASQQTDNSLTFRQLMNASTSELAFAVDQARKIRSKRERSGDAVMKVAFKAEDASTFDVVLCMSCEGDTAAIGLDYLFDDVGDWLESTVKFLNERLPGISIAVRQHPDERIVEAHQSEVALDRLRELKHLGFESVIFDSHSDASTYELSRHAKAVVVGATTFGLEAVMLGLPTIVFRRSYYADAGFVLRPESREDYFKMLLDCIGGGHIPSDEAKTKAHVMYYIVEACNRIRIGLTPQPHDFLHWLKNEPKRSLESAGFQRVLRTLAGEAPYAILKHHDEQHGLPQFRPSSSNSSQGGSLS